jgi:hypothetical protein
VLADREHARVIEADQLEGLNRQETVTSKAREKQEGDET